MAGASKESLDALLIQKALDESRIRVVGAKDRKLVTKLRETLDWGRAKPKPLSSCLRRKLQSLGIDDKNRINACKFLGIAFTTAIGILIRMREKGPLTVGEALGQRNNPNPRNCMSRVFFASVDC